MFDLFRRIRLNFGLVAIITIVIGLVLIFAPGTAVKTVFSLIGWMLVISGAISLLTAVLSKGQPIAQGDLVLGLIELATGLVVLMRPGFLMSLVGLVIGFVLLIHGVHDIQSARESKALGYPYKLPMIVGLLTLLMGIAVMLNPFSTAANILRVAGVCLLLDGIGDLVIMSRGMKR